MPSLTAAQLEVDKAFNVIKEGLGKLETNLANHQNMQRAVNTVEEEIARLQAIEDRAAKSLEGTPQNGAAAANQTQPQS
jgi:hypothetical protein